MSVHAAQRVAVQQRLLGRVAERAQSAVASLSAPSFAPKSVCSCGGGCPRCVSRAPSFVLQAKSASEGDADELEQEADRAADAALAVAGADDSIGTEDDLDTASFAHRASTAPGLPVEVASALGSGGRPLEPATRRFFEQRFAYDFGSIRLHTGNEAERSTRAVNALAYTVGEHVVMPGRHLQESATGRKLLAHELAHVVQQGAQPRLQRKPGDTKPLDVIAPFDGFVLATDEVATRGDRRQAFEHTGQDAARICELPDPARAKSCEVLAPGSDVRVTRVVVAPVVYVDTGVWYEKGGAGWYEIEWPNKAGVKGYVLGVFIYEKKPSQPVPQPKPPPKQPDPNRDPRSDPDLPTPVVPEKPVGPKPPAKGAALETFCKPFSDKGVAMSAHALNRKILMDFTKKFGKDVQELWATYMDTPKSGTKGVLPARRKFDDQKSRVVKEFRNDDETVKQRDALFDKVATAVKGSSKYLPAKTGDTTNAVALNKLLADSDRMNLPMRFGDPANKIPGNIAGGFGKDSSDAGDDTRHADGVFVVTRSDANTIRLRIELVFGIFDCIDFCPGAPGPLKAQLGLTDDLSRLEATPDVPTYDTPFSVIARDVQREDDVKL